MHFFWWHGMAWHGMEGNNMTPKMTSDTCWYVYRFSESGLCVHALARCMPHKCVCAFLAGIASSDGLDPPWPNHTIDFVHVCGRYTRVHFFIFIFYIFFCLRWEN
jgi:hypothetical protein